MNDEIIFRSLMNGLTYFNLIDSGNKELAEKKWEEQEALFKTLLKQQKDEFKDLLLKMQPSRIKIKEKPTNIIDAIQFGMDNSKTMKEQFTRNKLIFSSTRTNGS